MGHGFYLKTYYRRSLEERTADYLRAMPTVSFLKGHAAFMGRHFDVKVVCMDDEATVLGLLEDGYVYTHALNGKAVYKKEAMQLLPAGPREALAKHYVDLSSQKLKQVYEQAGLAVLAIDTCISQQIVSRQASDNVHP